MGVLDLIIIVLLVAWLGGFSLHLGGELIHFILVVAILAIAYRFITKKPL